MRYCCPLYCSRRPHEYDTWTRRPARAGCRIGFDSILRFESRRFDSTRFKVQRLAECQTLRRDHDDRPEPIDRTREKRVRTRSRSESRSGESIVRSFIPRRRLGSTLSLRSVSVSGQQPQHLKLKVIWRATRRVAARYVVMCCLCKVHPDLWRANSTLQ